MVRFHSPSALSLCRRAESCELIAEGYRIYFALRSYAAANEAMRCGKSLVDIFTAELAFDDALICVLKWRIFRRKSDAEEFTTQG